jgi:replicative DNA helicase
MSIQTLERIPPQNLEAEQGVLGSMLLDRDAIARVVEGIRPEDFYRDAHRVVYAAMLELFEKGEPVDLITVTNRLSDMGKLEDIGGATYLASLPNAVPTAANVDFYASIVLEKSILRALISAGTQIASLGYEAMDDVAALIDQAERLVFGIAARRSVQDFQAIKEILKASFEKIDRRYQEKGTITGVGTGFTDLDMLTSGLQPADMVVVAARPSVGKCLSEDAEILLEDGSVATIGQVFRRRRARLLTLGGDWRLRITEPSAFVDDGVKPVFRVTTRSGRTVECTAVHPFLTIHGWLPLASLRAGERIAVPRKIEVFGHKPLAECEVKLLAYLVGDRSPAGGKDAFTTTDPRIIEDFEDAVRAFGAVRGLMRHALWGKPAGRKEIPKAVFTLPRPLLALFLNRLFATDGRAPAAPDSGTAQIEYATASERLARQIQHLLLRFGVLASVRNRSTPSGKTRREAWRLEITDPVSLRTFAQEIGIFAGETHLRRVRAAIGSGAHTPGGDSGFPGIWRVPRPQEGEPWAPWARGGERAGTSPAAERRWGLPRGALRAIAQALRSPESRQRADSDIYWDEIVSIGPAGLKQVYDLTIPQTHNFVANDICVHNTTFATNIAQHAALTEKIPVAIFSLETSKEQLVQRILCSEAQVDNTKLRTGFLADEDWRRIARAMGKLSEAPIFIDDSASLSVIEMRAKARKLRAEHGLGLIVVDYIQMIQSYKRAENRTQELSEIARSLKSLAKELEIPIIAVSQLSRAVESLGSKRPMLSHLRESGEIEQVSDLVLFLYREDYYDVEKAQKDNKENVCEIIIAKHRNGPIGTVELYFHKEHSRFANLEKRRQ